MKKLLLPLIILLLIIGYFMSQRSDDSVGDAYDNMEKPATEETMPGSTPDSTTPPDMDSDPTMPQESDDVAPTTEDPQSSDSGLLDETKDAARDTGEAVKDAAEDAGDVIKDAAEDAGDAMKDAGEATKDAAEDAMDKLRGEEDKTEQDPQ